MLKDTMDGLEDILVAKIISNETTMVTGPYKPIWNKIYNFYYVFY